MKLNKKANQMMGWFLIFVMFILVITAYVHVWSKILKFSSKTGEIQSEMIKSYDKGEKALIFSDQATKYSIYDSIYLLGKKGGYLNEPACKYSDDSREYILWEKIDKPPCYPKKSEIRKNFNLFFNQQFNDYTEKYTPTVIPKNNYDLIFDEGGEDIEIVGIATRNIIISTENSDYSIKPSFRIKIPYKLISRFNEYSTKAQEIKNNIQSCLRRGSRTPDDKEDLLTCSDINKLKKEIEGIEHYQITPIAFPEEYTLLFDIEDPSFKNPYSNEKLEIKFGIRFLDTFPPPPTEITGTEDRTVEGKTTKHLTWYKNHASDVGSYEIYYKEIIESTLTGAKTKKPNSINQMKRIEIPIEIEEIGNEIAWKIDYENTDLEKGNMYYFYIKAKDNAGNFVEDIDIEPVELTI